MRFSSRHRSASRIVEALEERLPMHGTEPHGDGQAWNLHVAGHVSMADFGDGSVDASDLTSYVSPGGREYAVVGLRKGTGFVDVTDPHAPQVVAVIAGRDQPPPQGPVAGNHCHEGCEEEEGAARWRDLKTFGQYAYGVNETSGGLQIFDLSNIDSGTVVETPLAVQVGPDRSHNLAIHDGTAYLVGSRNGNTYLNNGGIYALDLTADPESPVFVGSWGETYVHDVTLVTYDEGPAAGRTIAYAFAVGSVKVIDVTDKGAMTTIATLQYPTAEYVHSGSLSVDLQYLFINDEQDEDRGTVPSTTTYVADVSDPFNPQYLTSFTNGQTAIDHNTMVRGDLMFMSAYESGVRVYDVSDPFALAEVGYYDTHPSGTSPEFHGVWGIDASLPSGSILASDIEEGLFIFDASALWTDPPVEGDLTGDRLVNRADLRQFFAAFGMASEATAGDGDLNDDEAVNLADLARMQRIIATSAAPSPVAAPALSPAAVDVLAARADRRSNRDLRASASRIEWLADRTLASDQSLAIVRRPLGRRIV